MRSMVYMACGSKVTNLLSCFLIADFSSSGRNKKKWTQEKESEKRGDENGA